MCSPFRAASTWRIRPGAIWSLMSRSRTPALRLIASVSVDGRDYPFELRGGYLRLSVPVPAGETRSVVIRYKNDLDLASISTSQILFASIFSEWCRTTGI